jgi:phage-related minor tail protein
MTGGGGTTGNVMGNLFAFGKSLFGFANGGMMAAGQPGIVGERGPELFVPQSAGKVISNAQAFGNREPQVINNAVNYTIQAVDASSFRSLIARDPNFIYAVTEQGRRNQPTRRSA